MSEEFSLDDDDFSLEEFDMDMGGLDEGDSDSDDRSVINRVQSAALRNFTSREGQLETAEKVAKKALPEGYSKAWDMAQQTKRTGEHLYDKAIKDIEPGISLLKQAGRKAVPLARKFLPKFIGDKLESLTEDTDYSRSSTEYNADENAISTALGDIFKVENAQRTVENIKEKAEKEIDREVDNEKFDINQDTQSTISSGIARLVGYQDTILFKYQQKSLELQHRQYFVARDAFAFSKAQTVDMMIAVKGILTNTALPNEIKLHNNEEWARLTRERLYGSLQDNIATKLGNMTSNLRENLGVKVDEIVDSINDNIGQSEMVVGEDSEIGAEDLAGMLIGEEATVRITDKIGTYLAGLLKDKTKIHDVGAKLNYGVTNKQRILNRYIKENEGTNAQILKELVDGVTGNQETINHDLVDNATVNVGWDILSRRTLVEIIPGYLSRQLQQLTMLVTGKEEDRVVYNAEREAFTTKTQLQNEARNEIDQSVSTNVANDVFKIIDQIDSESTLSDQAKVDLALAMTERSTVDVVDFSPTDYVNTVGSTSDRTDEITAVMRNYFNLTENDTGDLINSTDKSDIDNQNEIGKVFNRLDRNYRGLDETLNQYNLTNDKEILRDIGIITQEGDNTSDTVSDTYRENLNRSRFEDYLNQENNSTPEEAGSYRDTGNHSDIPDEQLDEPLNSFSDTPSSEDTFITPPEEAENNSVITDEQLDEPLNSFSDTPSSEDTFITPPEEAGNNSVIPDEQLDGLGESIYQAIVRGFSHVPILNHVVSPNMLVPDSDHYGVFEDTDSYQDTGSNDVNETPPLPTSENTINVTVDNHPLIDTIQSTSSSSQTLLERIAIGVENIKIISFDGALRDSLTATNETLHNLMVNGVGNTSSFFGKAGDIVGSGAKSVYAGGKHLVKSARNAATYTGGKAFDLSKFVGGKAVDGIKKGYDYINEEMDIFLDNLDGSPILSAHVLRAGGYFDEATGEVLERWKDIKGPVVDQAGNVVLTLEQFGNGDRLKAKFGVVRTMLGNGYDRLRLLSSEAFDKVKQLPTAVGATKDYLLSTVSRPRDVYLKSNMDSPILYKSGFVDGIYYNQSNGKQLVSQIYINGPVKRKLDGEDETEVVVSDEQLKEGLVYEDGSAVEFDSPLGLLKKKGLSTLKTVKDFLAKRLGGVRDIAGTILGSVRDSLSGLFGNISPFHLALVANGDINRQTNDHLSNIYTLLVDKLGEPSESAKEGIRKLGEVESVEEKESATSTDKDDKEEEEMSSNVGKLGEKFTNVKNVVSDKLSIINDRLPLPSFDDDFIGPTEPSFIDKAKDLSPIAYLTDRLETLKGNTDQDDFIGPTEPSFIDKAKDLSPVTYLTDKLSIINDRLPLPSFDDDFIGPTEPSFIDKAKGLSPITYLTDKLETLKENTDQDEETIVSTITTSVGELKDTLVDFIRPEKKTEEEREADRKGSVFNQLKERRERKKKEMEEGGSKGGKKSLFSRIKALNPFSQSKKKEGDEREDMEDEENDLFSMASLKKVLPYIATAGSALAGGYTVAKNGGENVDIAAGAALLGGVAAAALGLISAPVLAGGALIGSAVYSSYKAYKAIERRTALEPIEKLRYLQYGISINNKDMVIMMRYLEDRVLDEIEIDNMGVPHFTFDSSLSLWSRFYSDFGGIEGNAQQRANFDVWFFKRFIPVAVRHKTAAHWVNSDLLDIDDELENDDKAWFVSQVQFKVGGEEGVDPYGIYTSPWPGLALIDNLKQIADLSERISVASYAGAEADISNDDTTDELTPTQIKTSYDDKLKKIVSKKVKQPVLTDHEKEIKSKERLINTVHNTLRNDKSFNNVVAYQPGGDRPVGDTLELMMPTEGVVNSPFGTRTHPITHTRKMHKGIDIKAPMHQPVYAAGDGTVTRAWRSASLGNVVYIKHSDGKITRYAHLNNFSPALEALGNSRVTSYPVKKGDYIGNVGVTGNVTGPHLHFELRDSDGIGNSATALNPLDYFNKSLVKNIEGADEPDGGVGERIAHKNEPKQLAAKAMTPLLSNNITPVVKINDPVEKKVSADVKPKTMEKQGIAPIVNVAAPDLDTIAKSQDALAAITENQLGATETTNDLLTKLIETVSKNTISGEDLKVKLSNINQIQLNQQSTIPTKSVVDLKKNKGYYG